MKKKFPRKYLNGLDLPYEAEESHNLGESGRWTDCVEIVFRTPEQQDETPWKDYDGPAWRATYDVGKSEVQDDGLCPWEYEEEVTCTLVRRKPVTTVQWVEVDE